MRVWLGFCRAKIIFGGGSLKFLTVLANLFARFSVRRWNRIRVLRGICRAAYRGMGNVYTARRQKRHPGMAYYGAAVNTYPWPYSDPNFAPWEEDDREESYTLITDPANFVIRRSTSYVAWKIFELTGRWPLERGNEGKIFHAKYWQEFLRLNGYDKIVTQPERGHYYVGIIPSEGEFGQVVWFEGLSPLSCSDLPIYTVSTYTDFKYQTNYNYDAKKAIWVEIC